MILNFDLSSRTEEDIHDDDKDGVDGRDDDEYVYVYVTIARGLPVNMKTMMKTITMITIIMRRMVIIMIMIIIVTTLMMMIP